MSKEAIRRILLVDDSESDVLLTVEAFRQLKHQHEVITVSSGHDALDFIHYQGEYKNRPPVDLVLLDINLPGLNGKEVLKRIKGDVRSKKLPVIMLSSSRAEGDINESYSNNANSYLVKPMELSQWFDTVKQTADYWFGVSELPQQ